MILTCQGVMQKKRRQEPTADKERLRIGERNSWQTGYDESGREAIWLPVRFLSISQSDRIVVSKGWIYIKQDQSIIPEMVKQHFKLIFVGVLKPQNNGFPNLK